MTGNNSSSRVCVHQATSSDGQVKHPRLDQPSCLPPNPPPAQITTDAFADAVHQGAARGKALGAGATAAIVPHQ
jgi:hypothetical protein